MSFWGMQEFTWIFNIYFFTLNAILFHEIGNHIYMFLRDLSNTEMLIRLLHFDKILHVSHLKRHLFLSISFKHIHPFQLFMWFRVPVYCIRLMRMSGLLWILSWQRIILKLACLLYLYHAHYILPLLVRPHSTRSC